MAYQDMNTLGRSELPDDTGASAADSTMAGKDADAVPLTYPCSIAQERFWLLDRIEPGNSSLNVAVRWRLLGKVDSALLERTWLNIINRHEVLRTVFREVDSKPVQEILSRSSFVLSEIDLTGMPEAARAIEGDRIGVIEARAPFDLVGGPLVRATLLRYAAEDAVLLVTTHQIVSDGWSIGVMAREMGLIYQALATGAPIPLDDLPLQYADYAEWHLAWTQERGTAAEEAYWSRQLAGLKPFKVPADKARPAVPTTNGAIASIVLPRELTNRAQTVSAEFGATLFAAAFGALTTMLHRYTGETEIVIGTQVSDRDQVELEGMIGQFVNSLILRNDLSGDPQFGQLIERMRDTSAAALEHKHIPIERLLSMVKGGRRSANTALISVNFIFQRTFIQNEDYGAFRLVDMPSLPAGAIYDLNFFMVERPDGWRFSCQYNTDQFEGETVNRLLGYVQTILDATSRNPALRLSAIDMIGSDERRALLAADAEDPSALPKPIGLIARFAAKALQNPGAAAVVAGERTLSYRQLDLEAGCLAGYLRGRGVTAGTRVGICLERSADWPIALLALLRIGASSVALDPRERAPRQLQIIDAARVTTVITRTAHVSSLPGDRLTLINLDAEAGAIARATAPHDEASQPDSEACVQVVATAQGRPTVFGFSQAAIENRLIGLSARPGLTSADTLLSVTPFTLETALIDLLLPLLIGARVVIATDSTIADPQRLLRLIGQSGQVVLHAAALTWARLIAAGWNGEPRLRAWCSGERLDHALARNLIKRAAAVWTLYTAPGSAICTTVHALTSADEVRIIGAPLPDTRLRVLDEARQLLPTGAFGELHVGGDALPLGKPFVPGVSDRLVFDPFDAAAGARLLRTGDRVRARSNGQFELHGRSDGSDRGVRVDGLWIEPAEIEALLARHPNVDEAAARVSADPADGLAGNPISAWVTLAGARGGSGDSFVEMLRSAFASSLPPALMPSRLQIVDSLPRTADGSVDFAMLGRSAVAMVTAAEPASALEKRVARLWASMLNRDDIAADSNFFEFGGHSLLAARMLGRVEADFGRRVSLAALFRAPTVREFARLLESDDTRDFDFRQVVKLQPNGSRPPMIAINNTGTYYLLAKRLGQDQPVTSLQLFDPSVSLDAMPKTLEEIAHGYVQLIRRVQPKGPYLLMGWCVAGALAFEVARQLQAEGQPVANLYLMDSWVPNYLKRLSPLRRLINGYTLRWQFVILDYRSKRARGLGLGAFLSNRSSFRSLVSLFRRAPAATLPEADGKPEQALAEPVGYDQWLLGYLQDVTSRYEPKRFDGAITLFRSVREPTGLWFDPNAGWTPFASEGVRLHIVDGDHFTMFQEPGVSQMAQKIVAGN